MKIRQPIRITFSMIFLKVTCSTFDKKRKWLPPPPTIFSSFFGISVFFPF